MSLPNVLWLAGYLLVMLALTAAMFAARAGVFETYGTLEAKAEWEAWRAAARKQSSEDQQPVAGPVQRRTPKSADPPALVLMRDYFATCLAAALFFSSLLFAVTMIVIRGAIGGAEDVAEVARLPGSRA
jgi:hypothetical protein